VEKYRDRCGDLWKDQDVVFGFYLYTCLYRWFNCSEVKVAFWDPSGEVPKFRMNSLSLSSTSVRPSFPTLTVYTITMVICRQL